MYLVKQSTALTVPFFAHDVNGDGVTGLVDGGFTKRISKGSGAWAAMTVTITEMENGWYSFPLSATHSDTLGLLSISFSHGSTKRVNLQWRVEAALLDNLATPTNITAATGVVLSAVTHTGAVIPTVSAVTGLTAANLDATVSSRMATYTQPTGFLTATFPAGTVANTTNITAGTMTTTTNLTTNNDKTGYVLSAIGSAALTEDYAADGVAPTMNQMLYQIYSALAEFAISGTTLTCKRLDGTTTSMTFTLDSATAPTSRTRAT